MKNKVELYLDDKIYFGWKGLQVMRSIECMSGAFTLDLTRSVKEPTQRIESGVACKLEIDAQRVITGYVDKEVRDVSSDMRTITVTGRDKTADLIDCDALIKQWNNATLSRIAGDIAAPYGIDVIWNVKSSDAAVPFRLWKTEPSETAFETLARAARHRGVIVTSNEQGALVFETVGSEHVAVLTLGENIRQLSVENDFTNRFSEYRVIGACSAGGSWGETQTPAQSTRTRTVVSDNTIKRHRPKTVISDDNLTVKTALARAQWEQKRTAAHGQPVTVIVQGWLNNGALWRPNTLVTLNAPDDGYDNRELLVVTVTFDLTSDGGTTATLLLMDKSGFEEPAQKESKTGTGGIWY